MIRILVAITTDGIIGVNGKLPFSLADDLKFFKKMTIDRVVLMGRKTYESIGKPLPHRVNVVISRTSGPIEGCVVFKSPEEAMEAFGTNFDVIGGAEIYDYFLHENLVDDVYVTDIHAVIEEGVLTRFPVDHLERFEFVETIFTKQKDDKNEQSFSVSHLKR